MKLPALLTPDPDSVDHRHRRFSGAIPADALHGGRSGTNADNLTLGPSRNIRNHAARRAALEEALGHAGLSGLFDRDPATVSGGQRARAALMRPPLADPLALLLDEPFSKLNAGLRAEIRSFTFDHIRAQNIPALMVTHDEAVTFAGEGAVVEMGRG